MMLGVGVCFEFVKLRNEAGVEIRESRGEGYGWGGIGRD